MHTFRILNRLIIPLLLTASIASCGVLNNITSAIGLTEEEEQDQTALLALAWWLTQNDDSTSSPPCNTSLGSGLPSWITDNFTCMTIYVSGSNYVFESTDQPPYNSMYYTVSDWYEAPCNGNSPNPNTISAQNIVMTIPQTQDNSNTASTLGIMGLATNGVALFNDQAAPGDTLANEVSTFDCSQGHPTDTGRYHYHTQPTTITNGDSALTGVMIDGYPLYGQKNQDGSDPGVNSGDPTSEGSAVTDPHGHTATTNEFGTIFHYHVGDGTSGTVYTYLIGTNSQGSHGTVSN